MSRLSRGIGMPGGRAAAATAALTPRTPASTVTPWTMVPARKIHSAQSRGPGTAAYPSSRDVPVATANRGPNSNAGYLKRWLNGITQRRA